MANEFQKAADDAKRLLSGFSAVATVAAAFEKVGGLQQAQAEAESALASLKPQIASAQTELAQAKQDVVTAKSDAKEIVAKAKDAAEGILLDASMKVAEIIQKGNADAEEMNRKFDEARAAMDAAFLDATTKRDRIAEEVADLEARAEKARKYISKLAE